MLATHRDDVKHQIIRQRVVSGRWRHSDGYGAAAGAVKLQVNEVSDTGGGVEVDSGWTREASVVGVGVRYCGRGRPRVLLGITSSIS